MHFILLRFFPNRESISNSFSDSENHYPSNVELALLHKNIPKLILVKIHYFKQSDLDPSESHIRNY